jgi:hypothetical protein
MSSLRERLERLAGARPAETNANELESIVRHVIGDEGEVKQTTKGHFEASHPSLKDCKGVEFAKVHWAVRHGGGRKSGYVLQKYVKRVARAMLHILDKHEAGEGP